MSKRVRVFLGAILLTLMSVYFALYSYSVTLPKQGSSDGFSASWDGTGDPRITSVDPDGPAAGLVQAGDEMIAIDGVKIKDNPGILIGRESPPGTRFTLTIRRVGELRDVSILTVPNKSGNHFDPYHYISLLFLLTGWAVFLLRPDDKQAWLLAIMLATLIEFVGNLPSDLPAWLALICGIASVSGLIFFPVFVHFFLIFPDRSPLLRHWPRLETLLYLPFLLVILPAFGPGRLSPGLLIWLLKTRWFQHLTFAGLVLVIAYLAAGLVCLVINYRAANPIARRRLRVVMAGSAAGFFNFLILVAGDPTGLQRLMPTLWSWFSKAVYVTFPLVPLSFVYAIVRHKVIPVSLIIRRGMRYLLVSRGSIVVVMAGVSVLLYFVMDAIFFYLNPRSGKAVGVISGVIAVSAWLLAHAFHRRIVVPRIDRLFFRQAYDAQQIIAELAESLRTTTSLPKLLELVAQQIQSALHAANVTILLRDESGDYRSAYSCVYSFHNRSAMPSPHDSCLPRNSAAVARLAESGEPIDLDGRDPQFRLQSENGRPGTLSGEERETLQRLESALLLPIAGKDGLLGVISLGAHLGDLPFSGEDKKLLLSVSGPTSFALENARLIERMIDDARRRQELEAENEQRAKELEEARQLQLSMLPKSVPQLPHLEIAAYMKPATEVGGDYYDFHLADDGTLTIVVGDATGHGLKAGTVVTATKSLFNHLAATPGITDIFQHSSRALKLMNLRALYMAMTMVKVRGYRLTISAAGMPPVLVYRAADHAIEEVFIKGIPLGSLTGYAYREEEIVLSSGDVVVLMSDGFPERFNRAGEMLGYAKADEVLIEMATRSSQEIIEGFVAAGDQWAAGQPQDDDVTFVVLRVR
jgi:sigma-B regulation protein RsbU (phosphoserine phosphatase)